jgi:molecular chaperone GrpE
LGVSVLMEVEVTSKDKEKKTTSTSSLHQQLGTEKQETVQTQEEDVQTELLDHPSYKELQNQLTDAEKKANEYWDRILRMQAEKTNMERIAKQDIENAYKYSLEKFASDLLPVIDSLERAIEAHTGEAAETGSLLDGVQLTLKMFQATCEKFGIKQIDPIGQAFNPEFHQAVSTQPMLNDVKPGTVMSVLQKGYLLNNRLIRPALVIVAK